MLLQCLMAMNMTCHYVYGAVNSAHICKHLRIENVKSCHIGTERHEEWCLILVIYMGIFKVNKQWLVKQSFKTTTTIFSLLAMLTFLFEWTEAFSSMTGLCRILFGCGIFVALYLLVLVSYLVYLANVKEWTIYKDMAGHTIKVRFGDILSQGLDSDEQIVSSIVIPVNRCFDCIIDDKLIASSTLHGKSLLKIYKENSFSPDFLNSEIQRRLSNCEYTQLTSIQKPSGNLKRYSAGTTVSINCNRLRYFLLGLSSFDENLKASTSKEEYSVAIQKLYEFCDSNAQGGQVFMPIIGTGLSRVVKDKNDAIKYLINMAILNDDLLSYDLVFVVPDRERNNISITNI